MIHQGLKGTCRENNSDASSIQMDTHWCDDKRIGYVIIQSQLLKKDQTFLNLVGVHILPPTVLGKRDIDHA